MLGKILFHLLIFCGIWSQGIMETMADENIGGSSRERESFHARQKRVVSHVPGEDRVVNIDNHPYIVNIKAHNRTYCVGTILSHRVVLTAAECVQFNKTDYKVYSRTSILNRGESHNVREIKLQYGHYPGRPLDGIALLNIDPAIELSRYSLNIEFYDGRVLPGMLGTVIGWGYNKNNGADKGTEWLQHLRSIQVPIMAYEVCANRYQRWYAITEKDICTFDPLKRSGHTDFGAPLVINNLLVGIFIRRGPIGNPFHIEYPDVFARLQHTDYRSWIMANI